MPVNDNNVTEWHKEDTYRKQNRQKVTRKKNVEKGKQWKQKKIQKKRDRN
jgi:hypothetical protein